MTKYITYSIINMERYKDFMGSRIEMKNSKKAILILCVMLLMIAVALLLAFLPIKEVIKSPTCDEKGYKAKYSVFGKEFIIETYEPLGHDFREGKCVRCQKHYGLEVSDVDFVIEGQSVDNYEVEYGAGEFLVKLLLNGDAEISLDEACSIEWGFDGESYGSSVSKEGVVTLGDMIGGQVVLCVEIRAENTMTASLPITISFSTDKSFDSFSVILTESGKSYKEGQHFDADSISVWGEYADKIIRIFGFEYDDIPLTPDLTELEVRFHEYTAHVPIHVQAKELQSLEIVTPPERTIYYEGQCFDTTGLKLSAKYEYLSEMIDDFDVDTQTPLKEGTTDIAISYSYHGVTKTVLQPIEVVPKKLISISVDDTHVQKKYTIGDIFDPTGLIVKAEFDYFGLQEVFNYEYDKSPLRSGDSEIAIRFASGSDIKFQNISIIVKGPYEQIGRLHILSPSDISIGWAYSYETGGNRRIDYTAYKENRLVYDKINGIYEIPVGAIITASLRNPALVNIILDGEEQSVDYQEKTVTWKLRSTDEITIGSVEMAGIHSVIRFTGDDKEQSFLYDGQWNGRLTADNLLQLSSVYADTDNYYYSYLINGRSLFFWDLENSTFVKNSVITVAKNVREEEAQEVFLHIGEEILYGIRLSKVEASVWDIPVFTRAGYLFEGWALSQNGTSLSDMEIQNLLNESSERLDLYIIWHQEVVDFDDRYIQNGEIHVGKKDEADVQLIGLWELQAHIEAESFSCEVQFYANGSFTYQVKYNGVLNCLYSGLYRISGNRIVVISSETEMNIPLLNGIDFGFEIRGQAIVANLIVISGELIEITSTSEFEKTYA